MLCFFAMGFVDLVGIASNYVKGDLGLSDSEANFLPSLVFFWFLIFSVPTGMLMNKIGRKRTVLVSLIITAASLVVPLIGDTYAIMLISFSLLGIGNAVMQTSLNPLVTNLIGDNKLASALTFGQFVKAIASFLAPIIAAWGASYVVSDYGLGWKILFLIYAVVSLVSIVTLAATPIKEARPDKASGVMECIRLLGRPFITLCFFGIICHVGIDVGTNTIAPKILMERLGLTLAEAGFATSVYFIFRTIGCFAGGFLLRSISSRIFFGISAVMMLAGMVLMAWGQSMTVLYIGIGLVGFGNSNIFPIVFAQALTYAPTERNEVSGLMIMGLFGGTIFPLLMGYASDAFGAQIAAVAVMTVGVIYLLYYTTKVKA
ncbi:MAG: sugar MFS transporter [Bacteroidales bacterium]|nr:sugar MFS transporter [Bacteroidales bacterium]